MAATTMRAASRITLLAAFFIYAAAATAADTPKLILQITVDQLRADLPLRYYDRLGEGGFRYLYEQGIVYRDGHHPHANTETIVGHTTLATGAYPAAHGMIGNLWFDRETGFTTYNVEDPAYGLLTEGADVDDDTEIDPTQRAARSDGRSPAAILVSTFSDELKAATAGNAKVIGVSVKDRGAISMAGHAGTAYWFSKASGEFVTSSYYLDAYPPWVSKFNAAGPTGRYDGASWKLSERRGRYLNGDSDDREWEADVAGFGRTFPHAYGDATSPYFTTLLTLSPAGDELVLDFAKQALTAERLGRDETTDYLSVSFSSTDYVGHVFGPSSLEAEDNILRLDRTLADLLAFVDSEVGLDNTLVVLSADHGGPDTPGYLENLGIPAGYVDPESWNTTDAVERIKSEFGIEGELIATYAHPYIYLDTAVVNDPSIDRAELQEAVAREVRKLPGVAEAISAAQLDEQDYPAGELYKQIARNYHAKRSGDVFIVFEPNWFINDFDGLVVASTHGSPWNYDTHVPIIFAGAGLAPAVVYRRVHTTDIAVTLSTYLGLKLPSGASGRVLEEVVER